MGTRGTLLLLAVVTLPLIPAWGAQASTPWPQRWVSADNANSPASPVKLIFVHHSCGQNWLSDDDGGLGRALRDNNYFVSDTNYGWGPDSIGDLTDIGHWWTWFRGPSSGTYLQALYAEYGDHSFNYSRRTDPDPSRENQIVMFKSCFPNSQLGGNPDEPPTTGANPLRGQDAWSEHMTVANAKGIYNDILATFATRPDKLFVVITAPPLGENDTDAAHAANARAFNNWLCNDWLRGYPHNNVAVWDFYNILTSNGGNAQTNDAGWEAGNHHRWWRGAVQRIQTVPHDFSAYPSAPYDSHPTTAGNQKATAEFVQMLNVFYHRWMGSAPTPGPTATHTRTPVATSTTTRTSLPTATRTLLPSTATARPTATDTAPPGQHTVAFQDGVSPDASYVGTRDTILALDASANANLGGLDHVETYFADEEYRRSLLRWDLSALPAGIQIDAATVQLYHHEGAADNLAQVALYRLTREWVEGTGTDFWPDPSVVPDGATWGTAAPGVPWAAPGGDFDRSSDYGHGPNGLLDVVTLPTSAGSGWMEWDVTAAVRAWVEGGLPNHGLLLRALSGEWSYHYYRSRNHSTPSERPRLVVTYSEAGAATATATHGVILTPTGTPQPTTTATARETLPQAHRLHLPIILKRYTRRPPPTATPPSSAHLDVQLTVANTLDQDRSEEPVTSGLPIPRSANLTDLSSLRLLDEQNRPVPVQFTPLARWGGAPDQASKPVRWLLLDLQANVPRNTEVTYRLVDSGGPVPAMPEITVTDGIKAIIVHTGVAAFRISKEDGNLTGPHLSAPLSGRATDAEGREYHTRGPVSVEVALSGPMRVSIHVKGAYRDAAGAVLVDYTSRYWFYAGQPVVRLFHTVENNRLCPLVEYGQLDCYDIGSGGSVTVHDLSLRLGTDLGGSLLYHAAGQGTPASGNLTEPLLLYQDSSGTDHWNLYATFSDWYGNPLDTQPRMQSYVRFRGYRTTVGATVADQGDHAVGWLGLSGHDGGWTVGVRDFWQSFPKALRALPDGTMEIGLFPGEFGPAEYGFNLRAGEHKTHELWLSASSAPALAAVSGPLFAAATPAWYVRCGAIPFLASLQQADWPDHEWYVHNQLYTAPAYQDWMDWFPNLLAAIEETDFYGIFDYGDVPLDYEGYLVSPMNPKYHMDYGMWMQWARSGEQEWFRLAEAADRHIADIDILHNEHTPRHWGDGIMFGHSSHDEPGFLNPHRNFQGSHPDTAFGVPGLLAAYYWTGYEKALESALELAECIEYRLYNDGHLCGFFPSGECSGEGYALDGGMYAAGCRPAANNLSIAVAAYRATADPRYLAVADALVQWARASDQPYINGPTGQDEHMRPWMLNMYLRALADYLETRAEFGLPDSYDARGSYLAYADWLRTYPWLDLSPTDTGARAAYPYAWWFDGRMGIPGDENDNGDPSVNNWLLVGADALAYAYHLSGDADYLQRAARLFRTGSRDPWFEDDLNTYSATKEAANSVSWGHVFLHEWAGHP